MPSSAAVYGDLDTLPLTETMAGQPSSFYGLTKLTTESYLRIYHEAFGLPYICFRYANVYGPRQGNGGEGGVISIFCERLQAHKDISIFGDGEQTRDFVYVDDVVAANMAALHKPDLVGVINVSTERGTSLNKLVAQFKKIVDHEFNVHYEEARQGDIKHSLLSTKKMINELGLSATVKLDKGLTTTYEYFHNKK